MKRAPSILAMAWLLGLAASTKAAKPYEDEECLGCHSDDGLEIELQDGTTKSMFVDESSFADSVHGPKLRCSDCHPDEKEEPHPEKSFKHERHIALVYSEKCKRCHFANYTKTLDSVHHDVLAKGNPQAALCVDCHGAHDVSRAGEPRSGISQTCAKCHRQVYDVYAQSVHGKALLAGENRDVPVCTDCHKAHDIADPRGREWHLASPELCGMCHTNEALMAKYDLSPNVLSTYLADFHGVTSALQRGTDDGARLAAVCTDCHGVHDIATTKGEAAAAMRQNLVGVCQGCHPDASANFPAAWMSHYEPSLAKTPVVWAVKIFYAIFLPFVIGGLVLQILLHLWRVVVNR